MKPLLIAVLCLLAFQTRAQDVVVYPFDGDFEDATFAAESAIVGRGLNIEYTSHVGDMLNRTGADVGSTKQIFAAANIYLFCSALVSRHVMEADPLNIVNCPYSVFVLEDADGVKIGHRTYPAGPMQEVQTLLDNIVKEALE
jgi:uncharacterized protein (DUF302 family)